MQAFLKESTSKINSIANATKSTGKVGNDTASSIDNLTTFHAESGGLDLSFEDFTAPGINLNLWFLDCTAIGDVAFLADYTIRIYFTIRMLFKYWSASAVKIPQIDIRTDSEIATNPLEWRNGRLFIAIISSPLTGLFLTIVISSWIVTFTKSVYIPIFNEFRSGCVPDYANGTFISENVYSAAYNYAYNKGSSSLVEGVENLEKVRTRSCSIHSISSARKQNEDARQLMQHSQLLSNVQDQMGIFAKCIDSDILDESFETACCGQVGYNSCAESNVSQPNFTCPVDYNLDVPYYPPGERVAKILYFGRRFRILV